MLQHKWELFPCSGHGIVAARIGWVWLQLYVKIDICDLFIVFSTPDPGEASDPKEEAHA